MDIQPYIGMLRRRFWVIITVFLVTVAVIALGSRRMTPIYSASSIVRVAQPQVDTINYSDLNYTTRLIETYVQLLKSGPFLDQVIQRLSLPIGTADLGNSVEAAAIANTELISIVAESADPLQAAAIADTLAAVLVEQGQRMYTGHGKSALEILQEQVSVLEQQLAQDRAEYATSDGRTQNLAAKIRAEEQSYVLLLGEYEKARVSEALRSNSVSVVEQAVVPATPSKPNLKLNMILGALIGLLGGLGVALLLEKLDPTIHAVEDLAKRIDVPFLARIPGLPHPRSAGPAKLLLVDKTPNSGAEAFMALAANVSSLDSRLSPRSLLVTSAEPGAGKSTVAVNLAALLAQGGRTVIVVDGDVRNPCLHHALGLAQAPGLSEVLLLGECLGATLQQTKIAGLRALTAGAQQQNPAALWQGDALSVLATRLASEAEIVVWDTPPVLAAADALFLAPAAGAVLFVVARDRSRIKQVELALAQLKQVGTGLLSVVYNLASKEDWGYHDYYRPKAPRLIEAFNSPRSNSGHPNDYRRKFPRLIETWNPVTETWGFDYDRCRAPSDKPAAAKVQVSSGGERSVEAAAEH